MRSAALLLIACVALLGCDDEPKGANDGLVAPDFKVKTVGDGPERELKLSDHKDKVVLIDFWATWCGPCRYISPVVDDLYKKYHDKGFEVIAISTESAQVLKEYEKTSTTTYPIYRDFAGLASGAYGVKALPTQVLIGRDGKVIWSLAGADPNGLAKAVDSAMQ